MAQRNGVISLQAFLHKFFLKLGVDEGEFHRYHVIAADGLRDIYIHHLPISKVTTLTIDSTNLTADFPSDFIDYDYVAVERDGRYWTFTRDNSMVDKTITGITGSSLANFSTLYGPGATGGDNDYWFKPDYENRRFLFSGFTPSSNTVVLSYKSTGVESVSYASTTDVEFPVYAEDAMETYLRWKQCEYDNGPMGECERRKSQHEDAVRRLRNIHMLSVDEIRDIWERSSNQTFIRR